MSEQPLRTVVIVIVATSVAIGAYLLGASQERTARTLDGWPDGYYEYEGRLWIDSSIQDEGPVCFQTMQDGSTRGVVTPSTANFLPRECLRTNHTSASFVINQAERVIHVQSRFEFSTTPCPIQEHGYYPTVAMNLGTLPSGEYAVNHGDNRSGSLHLPTEEDEHATGVTGLVGEPQQR